MKIQRLRLKNEEQLKGAEKMLDYINQWANQNCIRYYEVENKYNTYEVVMGRDLNADDFNTIKVKSKMNP